MQSKDLVLYLLDLLMLSIGVGVLAAIESKRIPEIIQWATQMLGMPILALGLLNAIGGLQDYFLHDATVEGALHTTVGILYAIVGWKLWSEGKPPRRRRWLRRSLTRLRSHLITPPATTSSIHA